MKKSISRTDLTQDRLKQVLDYDPETGFFRRIPKFVKALKKPTGHLHSSGYIKLQVDGWLYQAHQIAWLYVYGAWADSLLDHINMDKSDNRIANLRKCDHSTNKANRDVQTNSKSGIKGIFWSEPHQKYRASLKSKHLGLFEDIEAAKAAYNAAAIAKYGDFARLV